MLNNKYTIIDITTITSQEHKIIIHTVVFCKESSIINIFANTKSSQQYNVVLFKLKCYYNAIISVITKQIHVNSLLIVNTDNCENSKYKLAYISHLYYQRHLLNLVALNSSS